MFPRNTKESNKKNITVLLKRYVLKITKTQFIFLQKILESKYRKSPNFQISYSKFVNMEIENYLALVEYVKGIAFSAIANLPLSLQMLAGTSMAVGSYKMLTGMKSMGTPTVAIIKLEGTIMTGGGSPNPLSKSQHINLESTRGIVDKAFSVPNLKLVCLVINSPGGSPAQSDLVYR